MDNEKPTAVILQSGFLTIASADMAKSDRSSFLRLNIDTMLFSLPKERMYDPNVFSTTVTNLYKEYMAYPLLKNDAVFKRRIVTIAKTAFVLPDFLQWCLLQNQAPNLTALHTTFIEQTLHFIATGKRSLAVSSWHGLLTQDETNTKKANLQYNPTQYFVGQPLTRNDIEPLKYALPSVIAKWIHQPGGYIDMLTTLYLLFGERNHIKVR